MLSSPAFGMLLLDRDPLTYGNLPGLIQAWLQDAGGFAALGLLIYSLYSYATPAEESSSARERFSLTPFMLVMGGLALLCYAALGVMLIMKKGYDPNEIIKIYEPGYLYRYEPPVISKSYRNLALTFGGLFSILGIGQPFVRDLFKVRFSRLWALTKLGFKEARSSKLIWVFMIFLLPFLFPAKWFFDVKAEDELRVTVNIASFSTAILTILPAALLAAFAIPNDIKNQTIYTIVTKPVERFEVVLGRFFGYTTLMTIFLLVMTTLSLVFISTTKLDKSAEDETFKARVPYRGTMTFKSRKTDFSGTSVGREFEYRKYIAGDPTSPQRALWNFAEIPSSLASGREYVPCEFAFDIFRLTKGEENHGVDVSIRFTSWQSPQQPPTTPGEGKWSWVDAAKQKAYEAEATTRYQALVDKAKAERKPSPPTLSAAQPGTETWTLVNELAEKYGFYEVSSKEIYDYHPESVPVPVGLFKHAREGKPPEESKGVSAPRIQIAVKCESRSQLLGMAAADLYLLESERTFTENYYRAAFGLWCRVVLIIGLAVCLSTYLLGVISLLGTIFFFVCGYFAEHLDDLSKGTSTGGGPFRSATDLLEAKAPTAQQDDVARAKLVGFVDEIFLWVIRRFGNLVPDVEGYSWAHFLREGFNINIEYLFMNFVVLVGYLLPWGVLAYYLMKSREVAN